MAKVSDIPFGAVRQVVDGARAAENSRRSCVRVSIELEEGAPSELVCSLRDALMPQTATGLVHVEVVRPGAPVRVNPDCDLAVVVAGTSGIAAEVSRAFTSMAVPCAIVVETSVEAPEPHEVSGAALIAATSPEAMLEKLATWMAEACRADIALATNFPFVRHAVSLACVSRRCAQNAAISILPLSGGAEMPLLTANQALMALDVAGAHGCGVSSGRVADIAFVVASAFACRGIARYLSKNLPGLGFLVRPTVAFGGTAAVGRALIVRYEAEKAWKARQQPHFCR